MSRADQLPPQLDNAQNSGSGFDNAVLSSSSLSLPIALLPHRHCSRFLEVNLGLMAVLLEQMKKIGPICRSRFTNSRRSGHMTHRALT